jgi:hypothetical protein
MLLFIIGVVSGFIGGMGIGGGTILIPSMIFLVRTPQQIAQGINLASFIPTSLAAVFVHSKRRHVRFKIAFLLILSGIPGICNCQQKIVYRTRNQSLMFLNMSNSPTERIPLTRLSTSKEAVRKYKLITGSSSVKCFCIP